MEGFELEMETNGLLANSDLQTLPFRAKRVARRLHASGKHVAHFLRPSQLLILLLLPIFFDSVSTARIASLVEPIALNGTLPLAPNQQVNLQFVLRDPLRNYAPILAENLLPLDSVDGAGIGKNVEITIASLPPASPFLERRLASPELLNGSVLKINDFTVPFQAKYAVQLRFQVLNPEHPTWEDPNVITRMREIELVEIGPGGEVWSRVETSIGTVVVDTVWVDAGSGTGWQAGLVSESEVGGRKYRVVVNMVDREFTKLNEIEDGCRVLAVEIGEIVPGGMRGVTDLVAREFTTAYSCNGSSLLLPVAPIPNTDAYSPFHVAVVSSDGISTSVAAAPFPSSSDRSTGLVPDLCSRQVFQRWVASGFGCFRLMVLASTQMGGSEPTRCDRVPLRGNGVR